ncbi:MAG: long-chain acyl-CoA synthetase [Gammaproteobacteria bacterium]|jgi:long-chain acyl-CoA synthetase
MTLKNMDVITPQEAGTLPGLFRKRVSRTPDAPAYRSYDSLNGLWMDISWRNMEIEVERWERSLYAEKLVPGDRVAVMARNSRLWVTFDQAALELGLIVVPIYTEDRADNVLYILKNSGAKLLLIGGPLQWERLTGKLKDVGTLKRVVAIAECNEPQNKKLIQLDAWLANGVDVIKRPILSPGDMATIVYTSGTTGKPKGVKLSHRNILSNVYSCAQSGLADEAKLYLSFLPLSHTFERTVGYYLPIMMGAVVAHTRSIQELPADLMMLKPEGLISVPRIFEKVYSRIKENLGNQSILSRFIFNLAVNTGWHRFEYHHKRASWSPVLLLWPLLKKMVADKVMAKLGGNLKVAISGGAALSPEVSRLFVGLGIPVFQGYGLTETSPVVSVNTVANNIPASIGKALADVEVKIGEKDELMVKGDSVMMGYWHNTDATAKVIDADSWFHTGDKARIEDGFIFITGRIKDIIVLSNGEKVSPVDMELAIKADTLFEQVMIIGEARPFLAILVVLNEDEWNDFAKENDFRLGSETTEEVEQALLERISKCLHDFPGYAQVYQLTRVNEQWTVENDMLTPTLKMKRNKIEKNYEEQIEKMYAENRK